MANARRVSHICEVCGKAKGGARPTSDHTACSRIMQERYTTTRRRADKTLKIRSQNHLVKLDK